MTLILVCYAKLGINYKARNSSIPETIVKEFYKNFKFLPLVNNLLLFTLLRRLEIGKRYQSFHT
jgi:hypothetical protein